MPQLYKKVNRCVGTQKNRYGLKNIKINNIMSQFRPQAYILEYDHETESGGKTKTYPTYRELIKNIISLIKKSRIGKVIVYRSRRGEWGEWCEHWKLNYKDKPYISDSGWM